MIYKIITKLLLWSNKKINKMKHEVKTVCYGNHRSGILEAGINTSGYLDPTIVVTSVGTPKFVGKNPIRSQESIQEYANHPKLAAYLKVHRQKKVATLQGLLETDLLLPIDGLLKRHLKTELSQAHPNANTKFHTVLEFLNMYDPEVAKVLEKRISGQTGKYDLDDFGVPTERIIRDLTGFGNGNQDQFYPVFSDPINLKEEEKAHEAEKKDLIEISQRLPYALSKYFAEQE